MTSRPDPCSEPAGPRLAESALPCGAPAGAGEGAVPGEAGGVAREAVAAVLGGLGALAGLPAAGLPADSQAECLRALEKAESMLVAARSAVLAAFASGRAFEDDGQYSARSWLVAQTRVTRAAAAGAVGWSRRLRAHPSVAAALAAAQVSQSWARRICDLSDQLPEDDRAAADAILIAAAAAPDVTLSDLHALAEEMARRTAPPDGDGRDDPAGRGLRLDTHYRGWGKLDGDLTPQCTAAVTAVLESLARKQGPEDTRTRQQRWHDALEEAFRRLAAAGGLPDRAGQPTQIQLHMTLDELRRLQAGEGSAPAGTGADVARSWLPGPAAGPGTACDATIIPVVTGRVDPVLLDQLASRLLGRGPAGAAQGPAVVPPGAGGVPGRRPPDPMVTARDLVLAEAVRLLSGPAGLAAALRAGVPVPAAAAASLPLDIGRATDTIPAHLRRAVAVRDRGCRFPGCQQPTAACDIHHIVWRSRGGKTRLTSLIMLCRFHHLIAIHEWGWTITLHPDATVTAVSPDGSRTLHGHSPPATTAA